MAGKTIVVCDDEELIRWSLSEHLKQEGYHVVQAGNGQEGLDAVRDNAASLMLLDLRMPVMDGLTALRALRQRGSDLPVIMITAHGAVDSAIEATRLGANAYLSKPFDLREVTVAIERALDADRLRNEVHYLRERERSGYGEFIGASPALDHAFSVVRRLERVEAPTVLIQGESGTGKDVLARTIHQRGVRGEALFMEIDCAAIPETLMESELFGHERGAFTGAQATRRGLFEAAGGGTVFMDEIGEMSLAMQAKLLRALESRSFRRVGGVATRQMDVGLIAATNRNLMEEVREGRFREDLFYRLNVVPIELPSLRERPEDIPLLIEHFLERFNRTLRREVKGVSGEAMKVLSAYRWPGNVRELRNVIERIAILSSDPIIQLQDLPPEIRYASPMGSETSEGCPFVLPDRGVDLEAVEKGLLLQAMTRTAGNQSAAARLLGISRYALRYRLEKYGIGDGREA